MPCHALRLSLSSMTFNASSRDSTTPSNESLPHTPQLGSFKRTFWPSASYKLWSHSIANGPHTESEERAHEFTVIGSPISKVSMPMPPQPMRRSSGPASVKLRSFSFRGRPHSSEASPTGTRPPSPTPFSITRPFHRRAATTIYIPTHESQCLQALSTRLYVAFEDDTAPFGECYSEGIRTPYNGRPFDNVVRITSHPLRVMENVLQVYLPPREHASYLTDMETLSRNPAFVIPQRDRDEYASSVLKQEHILKARDWIFDCKGTVLITTPRDARVEAMTVALAFLAYSTGHGAWNIMRDQNRMVYGFKSIWQYTLDERGFQIVKQVAAKRLMEREDEADWTHSDFPRRLIMA